MNIREFDRQFSDDAACLEQVFRERYPKARGFHRIPGRLAYVDRKGRQIYPLKGTIFEKSTTPLKLWFYAVYLFSVSRNGVSAKELQRQLGVTYKTAWRMAHLIRSTMAEDVGRLFGTVECDEAYVGGKRRLAVQGRSSKNKTPVFGMVERGGRVIAAPVPAVSADELVGGVRKSVRKGSIVMTDSFKSYGQLGARGYRHKSVNHSKWEYVRQEGKLSINTNTIEGFWSGMKRQFSGTHHFVSRQHLSNYLNEVTFRYNHRGQELFPLVLSRALAHG